MEPEIAEKVRHEYLKRALTILLRGSSFDSVSSTSLDVLCNIGVLYMQGIFSQVHSYAEHATRTRPNMNDVGRALDERQITVTQLDEYHKREMQLRQNPTVDKAIHELESKAKSLESREASLAAGESAAVFFDSKAEELLRRLVGYHMERVEAKRKEREREEKIAREKAAAAAAAAAEAASRSSIMRASGPGRKPGTGGKQGKRSRSMLSSSHGVDDLGLMGATSDEDDEGRDADVFEDVHGGDLSSPAKSRGLKRTGIRFDGVDDEEEEDEEDEDADFEAPEASIARAQSISASAETTDAAAAANPTEQQTTASNQANTAATATSTSTSGSKSLPDTPDNNRATATSAEASGTGNDNGSQPLDDEVEQLLLPTAALPEYIPTQCPAFPSPHSYKRTAVYPKREQDFFRNRMHKAEQSRQAEENLQRLISGPLVESSETTAAKDKESGVAMDNAGGGSESKPTQSTTASGSTNADESVEQSMNNGKQARKRIQQLFPPANFRNVDKRTRLTSFIK